MGGAYPVVVLHQLRVAPRSDHSREVQPGTKVGVTPLGHMPFFIRVAGLFLLDVQTGITGYLLGAGHLVKAKRLCGDQDGGLLADALDGLHIIHPGFDDRVAIDQFGHILFIGCLNLLNGLEQ